MEITLTEKEMNMLYAQADLIWDANDVREMARYGYQLATMLDTVFTMKILSQDEKTECEKCTCKDKQEDTYEDTNDAVSASIFLQGNDLNEVLTKIMNGIIMEDDE